MSSQLAHTGMCDTPTFGDDAATITPEGYVCESCAAEIAAHYEQARECDAAARGER